MLKYFSKKTGKEIELGSTFKISGELTPEMAEMLVKGGFIEVEDIDEDDVLGKKIIEKLTKQLGYSKEMCTEFFATLYKVNPTACLVVLLKKIAVELDKKYPDHISKCDEVFFISTATGEIHTVSTDKVTSFNGFAAFRTLEDAKTAKRQVQPILNDIFGK